MPFPSVFLSIATNWKNSQIIPFSSTEMYKIFPFLCAGQNIPQIAERSTGLSHNLCPWNAELQLKIREILGIKVSYNLWEYFRTKILAPYEAQPPEGCPGPPTTSVGTVLHFQTKLWDNGNPRTPSPHLPSSRETFFPSKSLFFCPVLTLPTPVVPQHLLESTKAGF